MINFWDMFLGLGVCDHRGMNDATGNTTRDTTRDTTDRATRHDIVSVNEAAVALGITPDSVRARLRRGSLAGEKQGTTWMVHLAPSSSRDGDGRRATRHDTPRDATRHRDTTSRDTDRDELLDELRADKRYLQEQLDRALRQLEAERQRADVLQALGTGTTSDTPPEAGESPQTSEPAPTGIRARVRRWWGG
jgi:hypothetical protein